MVSEQRPPCLDPGHRPPADRNADGRQSLRSGIGRMRVVPNRPRQTSSALGLSSHAPTKMLAAITPVIQAIQVPAAASAAVAAQVIEENASAKVAVRDEICRRLK